MTTKRLTTLSGAILTLFAVLALCLFVPNAEAARRNAAKDSANAAEKKADAEADEAEVEESDEDADADAKAPAKGRKADKAKKAAPGKAVNAEDAAGDDENDQDLGLEGEDEVEVEEVDKKAPLRKPMDITGKQLKTQDGFILTATYYPSNQGTDAVPVVLFPGWEGSRKDFETLALALQKNGYAVLVPDLRGHGESNKKEVEPENFKEVLLKKLTKEDLNAMVVYDFSALKKFLKMENNRGHLNVAKICVGGIEEGALIASGVASRDWTEPKKGKAEPNTGDVLAVFMISTPRNAKGVKFVNTFMPNSGWGANGKNLSYLFIAGNDKDKKTERIKTMESAVSKKFGRGALEFVYPSELDISVQGAKLIAEEDSKAIKLILEFCEKRAKNREFLWQKR